MRIRVFVGVVAIAGSLAACKQPKGVDIEPLQLVPKDATVVASFTLDPIRKSPVGDALGPALRSDADLGAMMTSVAACDVNLEKMHGVFATQLEDDDRFMAVVQTPGIGDEDVVRCMEKELGKITGDSPGIILFETRGDIRVTPQEGGGYLIILNKDAIAVVDKPWEDAVFSAIESADARNTDSVIAKAARDVPEGTDFWVAVELGDSERADLAEVPGMSGMSAGLVSADLSDGLSVQTQFDFSSDGDASVFREALGPLLEEAKPALQESGFPAASLEGIEIGGEKSRVTTTLAVAKDGLPKLITTLEALAGT